MPISSTPLPVDVASPSSAAGLDEPFGTLTTTDGDVEQALRRSEENYRALFESIDDGFCVMQMLVDDTGKTVDYRFLEVNSTFSRHTGLIDPKGKTARELVPDLDASWFEIYGRVADTGEPARFENHAAAMHRWFEVSASRFGHPSRRLVALVFKDITERKRFAEEREKLLKSETEARHEAELASRLRDEFLATLSHELRTPLTSMLGWVQMLRAGTLMPEKRDRALATVERNVRSQAKLIEDLLDVSRILAGKLQLDLTPVDLSAVVAQTIDILRPTAEAKGVHLQSAVEASANVLGDAGRLGQVVWNLVANAVKFTPREGTVLLTLQRRDDTLELTVADTGAGIEADFLPHVFERFRQADGGTTRRHGGLGLGLSIVRQLVEVHGGTITASSAGPGQGASFTLRLPAALKARSDTGPHHLRELSAFASMGAATVLHDLRALVVDDEEDTREMIRTLLESCGAKVLLSANANEALALLDKNAVDLIVSDVGMPDTDGYQFIEKVRASSDLRVQKIPAIALTAYARVEDRTRALIAGFQSHIPKPVEPVELVAMVVSLAKMRRHV